LLAERRSSLDPAPVHDQTLDAVLRKAFDDARAKGRSDEVRMMIRMLWADELLESQRQEQVVLGGSADLFVRRQRQAVTI
jgi:hypothetical protein